MQSEHRRPSGSSGDGGGQPAIRDERTGHRRGHRSSIGFRRASSTLTGGVTVDAPSPFASVGSVRSTLLDAAVFRSELARHRDAGEAADYVLDALGDRFTRADLDEQLDTLQTHLSTRGHAQQTISLIRTIAERTYAVEFADDIPLSERVLWPAMGAEAAGMEDARFVRFVDDDGSVRSMRRTRPTADPTSASSFWRRRISGRLPRRRWSEGRGQQGPGAVPASHRRRLRRHVEVGPRIEFGCLFG